MKAKMKRRTLLTIQRVEDAADRELARLGTIPSAEEQVAARFRAFNTLANQADPDLAEKLTLREVRKRVCAQDTPRMWETRHRLLTSVSTDSELLFLNRLYTMARIEATHVYQWSGTHNPSLDEPVQVENQSLSEAETRAYNALMQIGYDPNDQRRRVDLHTALVVQMVFHLIGLYKKGKPE